MTDFNAYFFSQNVIYAQTFSLTSRGYHKVGLLTTRSYGHYYT